MPVFAALLLLALAADPAGVLNIIAPVRASEDVPAGPACPAEPPEQALPAGIAARVVLEPEPVVSGSEILLGDVACIVGEADLARRLKELPIGTAPLVGGTREFLTATLNLRLRQGGIDDKTVEIVGPPVFTVRRGGDVLPGVYLQERVRELVLATLPSGARLTLTFQPVADLVVPEGDVELRLARLPLRWSGPISIGVDVLVQGKPWKSLTLRAEASLLYPVWVTTETVLKGETLGPHNTELRLIELGGTVQPADLSGERPLRANRVIQPGRIVEARFVELQPDAPKGSPVHVTLSKAGLYIQALGTLLTDGMLGELVTVRNVDSGRTFTGRLVSADRVVVEIP